MFAGPYRTQKLKAAEFYFYRDSVKDPLSISLQYPKFGIYGHAEIPFEIEQLLIGWIARTLLGQQETPFSLLMSMSWGAQGQESSVGSDIACSIYLDKHKRPFLSLKAPDDSSKLFYHITEKRGSVSLMWISIYRRSHT